jgi:plastocyanin
MLRLVRRAVPLGLLFVALSQTSALAATVNISQTNFVFTPKLATVQQGSSAVWTNATTTTSHTSTSDTTMPIVWDSGSMAPGATFTLPFTMAGKFTYHCTFHQSLGMVGTISVPVKAQPPSGPVGTMFKIIVASANATGTLVYDIQMKVPGGTFQPWMTGITAKSAIFNSTGVAPGTYQFRALLRDTATGKKSQFSAAKSISVT